MNILNYSCYNASTGIITALKTGLQADADLNTPYVLGHHDPELYRVVEDSVVSIADTLLAAKAREKAAIALRTLRDGMLKDSDWTQFVDSPLSDEKKNEWAVYRQLLRDIPSNYSMDTSLTESVWPTKPT